MENAMADVNARATQMVNAQKTLKTELLDRRDFVLKQLDLMTMDMKGKIRSITEDVEYKVGKAMSEEIRRLSVLVDEFNDPFHPDPLVLNVYKSRINHHIEAGIGLNLKTRLSSDLQFNIENHEKDMIDRMTALLPAERQQISRVSYINAYKLLPSNLIIVNNFQPSSGVMNQIIYFQNIIPRRDNFEVLYHLHFDNLCADFQEDIRFRFSLGFTAIIQRFLSSGNALQKRNASPGDAGFPKNKRVAEGNNRPASGLSRDLSPQFSLPPVGGLGNSNIVPDDWSIVSKVAIAAISSQGTMGGLLVGGLLLKTVGWRGIAITSAVYGGLYMYERLTWTNTAKCREFKRQYVDHAARKLRLVVDMTSANCSHQVQQELSSTFARLCHLVDETTTDLKEGIDRVDETLKHLDEGANRSKVLKNQGNFIANKLDLFDRSYLNHIEDN